MEELIIRGGTVITMCGEIICGGDVAISDGLISYAGRNSHLDAKKVIDADGCIVMPGLINAHTHLSMTLFRGFAQDLPYREWLKKIQSIEKKLTPSDIRTGAQIGILEMIRSGTTSFADMYIHMDEVAKAVDRTGMRASLGYGMIEGINEDAEAKLNIRHEFIIKWQGSCGGRVTAMYAPHSASSCSKEFLIKVRDMAKKDGAGIHIHVLETEDELDHMKKNYGMCSINLLNSINMLGSNVLAAHCIWLSDDDIEILKERKVNVVHCPSSNMALGAGVARVPEMLEKGINVALGTDGASSGMGLDMWKEMRNALLIHKLKDPRAMSAQKILEMATVNGAKALGINAGVIREGALADIIILDTKRPEFVSSDLFSSLVNGASGCGVRTTIVNGKVLMEDFNVTGINEERMIEKAQDALSRLC